MKKIVSADLSNLDSVSVYDFGQKTVFVDVNQIVIELFDLVKKGYLKRVTRKSVSFKFFQAIIHEFVHSYQDLLCIAFLERHAFLEVLRDSVLVHDGYNLTTFNSPSVSDRINGDRLYRRNHDLFPGERHADLTSFIVLMPIFEEFYTSKDADLNIFSINFQVKIIDLVEIIHIH